MILAKKKETTAYWIYEEEEPAGRPAILYLNKTEVRRLGSPSRVDLPIRRAK